MSDRTHQKDQWVFELVCMYGLLTRLTSKQWTTRFETLLRTYQGIFKVTLYLRMRWSDPRLTSSNKFGSNKVTTLHPDLIE